MALSKIAIVDVGTKVGKQFEFDQANVIIKGKLQAVTNSELVVDAGLNPGYFLHLDRRLITADKVVLKSE